MANLLDFSDPVVLTLYVAIAAIVVPILWGIVKHLSSKKDEQNKENRKKKERQEALELEERTRKEAKELEHSVRLNNDALKPWSATSLVYDGNGVPNLLPSDSSLFSKPSFRWAHDHINTGYAEIAKTWHDLEDLVGQEAKTVPSNLKLISDRLAKLVSDEFDGVIEPIDGYEDRSDVLYLRYATDRIWEELRSWVAHPERASGLEIASKDRGRASMSLGSAHLGYRITSGGAEIARVTRHDQAHVEIWHDLIDKLMRTEPIRTAARETSELTLRRDERLKEFARAMKELVERIGNGIRLKGSCELEAGF